MKKINLPPNLVQALSNIEPIVGVSPNAFSRVVSASFLDKYSILCLKNRGETKYAMEDADVFCLEKEYPGIRLEKLSTKHIISTPESEKYLAGIPSRSFLVYKPMPKLEEYCDEKGYKLLTNRFALRELLENKKNFREVLISSGVTAITGAVYEEGRFTEAFFDYLSEVFGKKLVFQIAEMTSGGGLGTSFIFSREDYLKFLEKLKVKKEELPTIAYVNVTKFIEGIPASIISVATSKGTIAGPLQAQIQDVPDVNNMEKGSGLYCGHDWVYLSGKPEILKQAKEIATKFGDYIFNKGYKGIFGMDLLVNLEENKVYPVECNPRYTDCFPIISMNCLKTGLIPLDLYHILEHANPNYDLDTKEVSNDYGDLSPCSQLVLQTKTRDFTRIDGEINAGVYSFNDSNEIQFERGGYRYEDLEKENEFLLTEGIPSKGTCFAPNGRIARLIFRRGVLGGKNILLPEISGVIANIYKMVNLTKIDNPKDFETEVS
jgi:hypothetical protein